MAETLICPHCSKSFEAWISQHTIGDTNPDAGMEQREQELCDQMES